MTNLNGGTLFNAEFGIRHRAAPYRKGQVLHSVFAAAVVKNTPALQRIIMEEGNSIEIAEQARKEGFNDLRTSGLLKAMQGITSLEEVNRVTKD